MRGLSGCTSSGAVAGLSAVVVAGWQGAWVARRLAAGGCSRGLELVFIKQSGDPAVPPGLRVRPPILSR